MKLYHFYCVVTFRLSGDRTTPREAARCSRRDAYSMPSRQANRLPTTAEKLEIE
ncbi:hypothetical protein GGR02_000244 [Anoxybacillus voinovskiensis]|uniref:Uncharacterized protein n=1 Tax=Anoxybacteroides voinovskiense TaxID=230470 RepID=A0A840DR17_9BACL|nr:hypothetical protein [Anoxybacillus voinovskiensis]MBB4072498.1 hypothetical protein [Anoxybacillus voinovskiensis]